MKKEFDLKIEGCTLESIKIDSSNSLIVATYKRDVAEFKAGDIIVDDLGTASTGGISIFKCINAYNDRTFDVYAAFGAEYNGIINIGESGDEWDYIEDQRLATDEEKQLLFDALKKEGLKWSAEKLEIENIKPEFKRGDILASKSGETILIFDKYTSRSSFSSLINSQDAFSSYNWYAPGFRHASIEEVEVFYKDLARMGKKWNAEKLEIEELDISDIVVDLKTAIDYLDCPRYTYNIDKKDKRLNKFEAQITLQLIAEAWNKFDGFEADWTDSSQQKFSTGFSLDEGELQIDYVGYVYVLIDSQNANFSFKTEERAKQFTEQFIDLFKIALGI